MRRDHVSAEFSHDGAVVSTTLPGGQLDARTARELVDVLDSLVDDRAVRVVRVRSEGDFCTGPAPDLDRFAVSPDPASALARIGGPVLVGVRGECSSVGLELALAGDLRIADRSARLRFGELDHGTIPCWGGTQRLARCVRSAVAVDMLLLGTEYDAVRAEVAGLVHEVTDDVDARLDEITEVLLGHGSLALRLTKEAVHRGVELPLRDGLRLEGDLNHLLAATEERAEGLAAFFDKRPPDFAGR